MKIPEKLIFGIGESKMKNVLNMIVTDAVKACRIYEYVFDGEIGDIFEFPERPNSNEANITIGNLVLRLIDENPEFDCYPPKKNETDSIWLHLDVADVESAYKKANEKGMITMQPMQEHLGQKFVEVKDPFGYTWVMSQTLREVSYEERMDFYNMYHSGLDVLHG